MKEDSDIGEIQETKKVDGVEEAGRIGEIQETEKVEEAEKVGEVEERDRILKGVEVDGMEYYHVGFNETGKRIIKLVDYIRKSEEQFDRVIFLATGGSGVGKGVKDGLGIEGFSMIRLKSYDKYESGEIKIEEDLPELTKQKINGERILLVDDLADSGKSLAFGLDYIKGFGASKIMTAALFRKPQSTVKPDFYTATTEAWTVSAHEYNEFINNFYDEKKKKDVPHKEIKKYLREIGIPLWVLRSYMPLMTRTGEAV